MIVVRKAESRDAAACSAILRDSIRILCVADHRGDAGIVGDWTANKTPERVLRWIVDPQMTLLLAERIGKPAGVGAFSGDGEILLNYVAPAHRFVGVSRALLARMEALLAEGGIAVARLSSAETAHRFYRTGGWVDSGEPDRMFGLTGYPMEKQL